MIRSALLAPSAKRLTPSKGKGINETWKGRFLLLDGSSVEGYAKFIDGAQLINELLANTLARLVGMNVPEPFLVRVDKIDYPKEFANLGWTAESILTFGTKALPHGSLAREWHLGGPPFIDHLLNNSAEWKQVVSFDTWVGNTDRHFHNLFWDGSKTGSLWLIDHGHCFGGLDWTEPDLLGSKNHSNRLLEELVQRGFMSGTQRKAVLDAAPQMQRVSSVVDLDGAVDDSFVRALTPASTAQSLVQYLYYRSEHLVSLVADQVGMPTLQFQSP